MPSLVLASGSPRRQQLLRELGFDFITCATNIPEQRDVGERPRSYVQRLAETKARAGLTLVDEAGVVVLGADTIVVSGDEVLEKPADYDDFRRMMKQLSGSEHQTMTAVAVTNGETLHCEVETSTVVFVPLTDDDMQRYWATGEPQDKAGGYGIQGYAARFVRELRGTFHGVMGLPLVVTLDLLAAVDMHPNAPVAGVMAKSEKHCEC